MTELSVTILEGNGMSPQQSVAALPRRSGLAPGTRHRYYLSKGSGFVQTFVKEFDGLALMVVDLSQTTHVDARDNCKDKLRPLHRGLTGEILVVKGNRLGSLRLAHHKYIDGKLQPKGSIIENANLGRIINTVG